MPRLTRTVMTVTIAAVVLAGCGGGDGQTSDTVGSAVATSATGGTDVPAAPVTDGETTSTTTTTAAPQSGSGMATTVTIDGTTYELSTGDDIGYVTRCEANYFGGGIFWVIATAVDDSGARAVPNVNLELNLPHQPNPDSDLEFKLTDDAGPFEYLIATDDAVVFQAGEFDGDLGSWTVEGNRITGEITVYEYDHVREYFTATFDVTCPET